MGHDLEVLVGNFARVVYFSFRDSMLLIRP